MSLLFDFSVLVTKCHGHDIAVRNLKGLLKSCENVEIDLVVQHATI